MIKKFLAILFAIIIGCLLPACAENSAGDADGNNPDTEQSGETGDTPDDGEEITEMYITVNNNKLKVTLAENSTAEALVELLKKGDITYTAHANNFEIYGDIGHSLPENNEYMTSQSGDVFLWAGDNVCIFFGNNSYSYTRIGKIEGYTSAKLKEILAPSSTVQVTISLK